MSPPDALLDKWETQLRKGALEYAVLLALADRDQYGFELIDDIRRKSGLGIPEGTLYPLMMRLVKDGLAVTYWSDATENDPPRKFYQLSEAGRAMLGPMGARWDALAGCLHTLRKNKTWD